MRKQKTSALLIVFIMVFSLVSSGCLGRFAAFNKLSNWNQKVTPNKFVNEVLFLALNIVPAYGVALFVDALVFNSLEFWTGNNPMMAESDRQKIAKSGPLKVVQTFYKNQGLNIMEAKYYFEEDLAQTLTLSQQADSPEFNGVVKGPEEKLDRFVIRAEETHLLLTRFSAEGHSTTEVIEGAALDSLTQKVAKVMDHQPVHVASTR